MIIAFDAVCLGDGPPTGVARAFLTSLHDYAESWADDMVVLVPRGSSTSELPAIRTVTAPTGAIKRQRALPRLLRELRADIFHSSVAAVPLRAPCATIATVHDLPWLHPESGERSTWWRRFATRRALRAATAVIAPSRFTRDAAASLIDDPGKLLVVQHSTPTPTAPPTTPAPTRDGPFVVLGDDRPRKNHARVRAAHQIARSRNPDLPDLRFVGPPNAWLEENEKPALLATCRAIVACSLYEGFGLPVLEAGVHGVPLICSDIPPHREIAPEHAVLVDPHDVEAIAMAFDAALITTASSPGPPQCARRWRELHSRLAAEGPGAVR